MPETAASSSAAEKLRASVWDDFGSDPAARVALYERAAAMADAGKLSAADAGRLLEEYRGRIENSHSRSSAAPGSPKPRREDSPRRLGAIIAGEILIGAAIAWPTSVARGALIAITLGVLVVIAITALVAILRGRYRLRRDGGHIEIVSAFGHLEECLQRRKCPDCEYSLNTLDPGIAVLPDNGLALGPRACPECGVKWPLVPPATAR